MNDHFWARHTIAYFLSGIEWGFMSSVYVVFDSKGKLVYRVYPKDYFVAPLKVVR